MTEIERRLRELGSSVRQPGWDRPLDPPVRRKIRRRRALVPAAAVCAAAAVGASATLLPDAARPVRREGRLVAPAGTAETTPAPRREIREVPRDGFSAVWPEDNPAAATQGCAEATAGSFRSDPVAMATAFAHEVMGWREVAATVKRGTEDSRQVELQNAAAPAARVNASIVELVSGCWAVQSVFDTPGDPVTGLVVDSTGGNEPLVRVRFEAPAGTAGEVEVGYGEHAETHRWSGPVTMEDPVEIELAARPDTTGHLFLLFEDATGNVTKALAYSLPPRHFSKEARDRAAGP